MHRIFHHSGQIKKLFGHTHGEARPNLSCRSVLIIDRSFRHRLPGKCIRINFTHRLIKQRSTPVMTGKPMFQRNRQSVLAPQQLLLIPPSAELLGKNDPGRNECLSGGVRAG